MDWWLTETYANDTKAYVSKQLNSDVEALHQSIMAVELCATTRIRTLIGRTVGKISSYIDSAVGMNRHTNLGSIDDTEYFVGATLLAGFFEARSVTVTAGALEELHYWIDEFVTHPGAVRRGYRDDRLRFVEGISLHC